MNSNDYIWVSRKEWERVVRKLDGIRFDQSGFAHHTPTGLRLKAYGGQATPPVTAHPFKIWYKAVPTTTNGVTTYAHYYAVCNTCPIYGTNNFEYAVIGNACAGCVRPIGVISYPDIEIATAPWTTITATRFIHAKIVITNTPSYTCTIEANASKQAYHTATANSVTLYILIGIIWAKARKPDSTLYDINPYKVEQHITTDIYDNFMVWR
jgi:hypothetical protein